MKKKVLGIILVAVVSFGTVSYNVLAGTDSAGGSGSGGGNVGGQSSSNACIWNGTGDVNAPNTYMIDLVKKTSSADTYTRIASAVVGAQANGNVSFNSMNNSDSPRSSAKRIYTTGTVNNISDINGLASLAKYLNKYHDIGDIGNSLKDEQVWGMMVDFGVAEKVNGSYQVKSSYRNKFNIDQSLTLYEDYGYRILIQEFFTYQYPCNSSGKTWYLLRKESADARNLTNAGGGAKRDLKIGARNALGITAYNKSYPYSDKDALKVKMNGAGYNIIWMDMKNIVVQYRCKYNSDTGKCKIEKKEGDESWLTYEGHGDVNCNDWTKGSDNANSKGLTGSYSLSNNPPEKSACPSVLYKCVDADNSDTYGKCKIQQKVGNGSWRTTKNIACNTYNDGTKNYDVNSTYTTPTSVVCPYKIPYGIDAACENCDTNEGNYTYVVQDTNSWDAILQSRKVKKNNIKNYYVKSGSGTGCEVYCRDTLKVTFPNDDDDINVGSGRYFVVNHGSGKFNTSLNVPNIGPIKVQRVRECRATASDGRDTLNPSQQNACLTAYKTNNQNKIKDTGTVTFDYKGNAATGNGKYRVNKDMVVNEDRMVQSENISAENNLTTKNAKQVLTLSTTNYYELPDGIYSCIEPGNGTIVNLDRNNCSNLYTYLGTSTIPIAFKNIKTKQSAGEITLSYKLPPSNTSNTKIAEVFKQEKYLQDYPDANNIYKKYTEHRADTMTQNQLKVSACAALYGYGTEAFGKCAGARTESTIRTCGGNTGRTTLKSGKNHSSVTEENYSCDLVNICPYGYDVCPDGSCPDENGICPNSCTLENDKCYEHTYDNDTGTMKTNEIDCSSVKDKYPDSECAKNKDNDKVECKLINKARKQCQLVTTNLKNGNKTTKDVNCEDYAECECGLNCDAGFCCPDTTMVCPEWDPSTGMWSCPGRSGIDIIYRVIDLNHPFPDQDASNRRTGANWCSYQYKVINGKRTQVTSCSYDTKNYFVDKHIINNRITNEYTIYQKKPLYEIKIDGEKMRNIRDYNRTHEYEDISSLKKYNSKSTKYYSTFLNNSKYGNVTGICSNDKNVDNCAEQ